MHNHVTCAILWWIIPLILKLGLPALVSNLFVCATDCTMGDCMVFLPIVCMVDMLWSFADFSSSQIWTCKTLFNAFASKIMYYSRRAWESQNTRETNFITNLLSLYIIYYDCVYVYTYSDMSSRCLSHKLTIIIMPVHYIVLIFNLMCILKYHMLECDWYRSSTSLSEVGFARVCWLLNIIMN